MTESKKGRWQAGQSGNMKGRPAGTSETGRLRAAIAAHLPSIIEQLVIRAKDGDTLAAKILLEKVLPSVRAIEMPVQFPLPAGASLADYAHSILESVAAGAIGPSQGAQLIASLNAIAQLREAEELERRLAALEGKHEGTT